jgi:hypothetical protein
LEKLAGQLYEERSRRGIGDFPLSQRVQGYWDKANTEIDLVAVNDSARLIRFGSCKRSPQKLLADVNNFKQHVERFLKGMPKYSSWTTEYVAIAPRLEAEQRKLLGSYGVIAEDLNDLIKGL